MARSVFLNAKTGGLNPELMILLFRLVEDKTIINPGSGSFNPTSLSAEVF